MAGNGGTFEVYYFKHRVTHIICSNLPNAKIKALEKERYAVLHCWSIGQREGSCCKLSMIQA